MRVVIDTTYARRAPLSGIAVYLERLCEALARIDGIEVVEAINSKRRPPAGGGIGSARNALADLFWSAVELPRVARRARADLIHHPLPALSPASGLAQVVTVFDLAFERMPEQYDRRFRLFAHYIYRWAARAAGSVVCISKTTARDVSELWAVPPEKMVVAHLGPGQELVPRTMPELGEPRHFLYVGDDEPRKNLQTLLRAYALYRQRVVQPLPLLLAGSASAEGPGISVIRRPGAHRLAELYVEAAALLHPSLHEGFGMTPLEAMSLGVPVLAARSPGILEVCGGAARYVEAHDPSAYAEAMIEVSNSRGLRHELGERGKARAAEFSWRTCARAHVDAYSLALRDEDRDPRNSRDPRLLQRL